eukprot:COSAG06_NODE_4491_length_4208_cov_2.975176_1_plen_113_part_00
MSLTTSVISPTDSSTCFPLQALADIVERQPGQLAATRSRRAWARCSEAELEVRTSGEALGVASAGFGLLDAAGRGGGADGGGIGSIGEAACRLVCRPAIANRPAILPLFDFR